MFSGSQMNETLGTQSIALLLAQNFVIYILLSVRSARTSSEIDDCSILKLLTECPTWHLTVVVGGDLQRDQSCRETAVISNEAHGRENTFLFEMK